MPRVEHVATSRSCVASVWDFVKDIGNWAPYVMGYQSHEVLSDTRSVWVVKGDVGPLARAVQIAVDVAEWRDGESVSFSVTGIDEQIEGRGSFTLTAQASDTTASAQPASATTSDTDRGGWRQRLRDAVSRWTLARLFRRRTILAPAGSADRLGESVDQARPSAFGPLTSLRFELALTAGGMMGAVVNAMIEPLLEVAARDLATSLVTAIESRDPRLEGS